MLFLIYIDRDSGASEDWNLNYITPHLVRANSREHAEKWAQLEAVKSSHEEYFEYVELEKPSEKDKSEFAQELKDGKIHQEYSIMVREVETLDITNGKIEELFSQDVLEIKSTLENVEVF